MGKRQNTVRKEGDEQLRPAARGRKPPGAISREQLAGEIADARALLDRGLSSAAEARLVAAIEGAVEDDSPTLLGQARSVLSEALEWQGRYNESLEVVSLYETAEARAGLEVETSLQLRVRLGLACNYTGDYPKAIVLLNATLREATEQQHNAERGAACLALARVYRSISEYTIARDHLQKALECYRHDGDWRGLGEVYLGLGLVDVFEGQYESALSNYEQALKLVGERAAPQTLGRLYANMGGVCWFIKRPHEGIGYLEKAVNYYERTEHRANAAAGYNNLGINLTLVGEWERAQEALKRALELAFEVDRHNTHVPIILNSLGELRILTGELEEAQSLLQRAVNLATDHGNKWYEGQARRTLGRCLLAVGEVVGARAEGEAALILAEKIGDRQAICESNLLLAETHLRQGNDGECAERLRIVALKTTESVADLAIAGAAQRIHGLLWVSRKDSQRAVYHFSRSVSISEMLGDRYSLALAHYELGTAYAALQPERARGYLSEAAAVFRQLGARLDLARAEEAVAALGHTEEPEALVTSLPAQPALASAHVAAGRSLGFARTPAARTGGDYLSGGRSAESSGRRTGASRRLQGRRRARLSFGSRTGTNYRIAQPCSRRASRRALGERRERVAASARSGQRADRARYHQPARGDQSARRDAARLAGACGCDGTGTVRLPRTCAQPLRRAAPASARRR